MGQKAVAALPILREMQRQETNIVTSGLLEHTIAELSGKGQDLREKHQKEQRDLEAQKEESLIQKIREMAMISNQR